jgi:HAD superfamily hydrolase (TIGR01509 family)
VTTHGATLYLDRLAGVIFDLDGVVTDTTEAHARAWQRALDEFLDRYRRRAGAVQSPFDPDDDYRRYIGGRPRLDATRAFLASRGIMLPEGVAAVPWGNETVRTIAVRQSRYFVEEIKRSGVAAFPATVNLVRELRRLGVRTAVVSFCLQSAPLLVAAHVDRLFDVRVDGADVEQAVQRGRPERTVFLEAARRLGAAPQRCAVIEDAPAGVAAGRDAGFGVVIGVDRARGEGGSLYAHGADVVVGDLTEISLAEVRHQPVTAQR